MRKTAVLVSLFIYLCATTCLGELLKAPVLFSHFIEHRENNNSISFYTFIYQHYQDDDGDDRDNDRDNQLPFKSHEGSSTTVTSAGVPLLITKIRFTSFSQKADSDISNYKEPRIPSPYLSRIWQPPKFS